MNKFIRKIEKAILVVFLILLALPEIGIVKASGVPQIWFRVDSTDKMLDSTNKYLLDDGTTATVLQEGDVAVATYDASSGLLILENYNFGQILTTNTPSDDDLTIEVRGNNTITYQGSGYGIGIYYQSRGTFRITSSDKGKLNIIVDDNNAQCGISHISSGGSNGFIIDGNVELNINLSSSNAGGSLTGIDSNRSLTIGDDASVVITVGSYCNRIAGIYVSGANNIAMTKDNAKVVVAVTNNYESAQYLYGFLSLYAIKILGSSSININVYSSTTGIQISGLYYCGNSEINTSGNLKITLDCPNLIGGFIVNAVTNSANLNLENINVLKITYPINIPDVRAFGNGTSNVFLDSGKFDTYDLEDLGIFAYIDKNAKTIELAGKADRNSHTLKVLGFFPASNYEIEQSTDGKKWTLYVDSPSKDVIRGSLALNKTYYYRARAYHIDAGDKVYSEYSSTIKLTTSLNAVDTPEVTNKNYNSNLIKWTKIPGAKGYQVYYSTNNKTWKKAKTTTAASFTHKKLKTGTTYYYKVRAYQVVSKKNVYGPFSESNSTKPYLRSNTIKVSSASYNSNKISYSKIAGRSRYQIYYSVDGITWKLAGTTKKTSYTHKKLKTGTEYYYKVRAYRTVSKKKIYSEFSNELSVIPYLRVPKFTLKRTGANVKATITKLAGASGYIIYRSDDSGISWNEIKRVTKLTYTDSALVSGSYQYKIVAYRNVGGIPIESNESIIRTVIVP